MTKMVANDLLVGTLHEATGVEAPGPVTTALVTTGASLLLTRGRRGFGAALLVAGGLLLWRRSTRQARAEARRQPAAVRLSARDGVAARGSR